MKKFITILLAVFGLVVDFGYSFWCLNTSRGIRGDLGDLTAGFALVGRIQDETHRFAIEYHRQLRDAVSPSALDAVPGVGPKRRSDLLKHFGTLKAIKAATAEELAAVVPRNAAQAVYDHFHKKEETSPCE